jgi:hypothetical protein
MICQGSLYKNVEKAKQNKDNLFSITGLIHGMFTNIIGYYSFFQHNNFYENLMLSISKNGVVFDLNSINYNFFPTMLFDWSYNKDKAEEFAYDKDTKDKGIVLKIDLDKQQEYVKNNVMGQPTLDKTQVLLLAIDNKDPRSTPNVNIQNQEGICIFWPWRYKIDELSDHTNNEIGRAFNFEIL